LHHFYPLVPLASDFSQFFVQVKFEGEGVDDYGGPYREIFQLICDELQMQDPSVEGERARKLAQWMGKTGDIRDSSVSENDLNSLSRRMKCFLPLLFPTPNFSSSGECEERYKYMFSPCELSELHLELYSFLGQIAGIAIRSKITLDLALPSYIWKCVAREPLSEKDIASFDAPAAQFISRLSSLHDRLEALKRSPSASLSCPDLGPFKGEESPKSISLISGMHSISPVSHTEAKDDETVTTQSTHQLQAHSEGDQTRMSKGARDSLEIGGSPTVQSLTIEMQEMLQDLDWTYVRSDHRTVELVQCGLNKPVEVQDVGLYLQLYVEARLGEGHAAIQAFRGGLASIVPESAFVLFSWEDVQRIVCGSRNIDINRLRDNTEYDEDVTAEDTHITYFWEILQEFSEEEKIHFLKFVWARPTLPPKGVEFLQKMKIQSAVGDEVQDKPDQYLPKAHTCFFSINLPRYSSKEVRTFCPCMLLIYCDISHYVYLTIVTI
jgi:HECT-domain (ubiquitin-transferase)